MKILISGCAGFIGYHVSKMMLDHSKNTKIYGVDNMHNYYSVKLKKKRLNILKKYKNFKFFKIDIKNNLKIKKIFLDNKFDTVIHLAAQAGVRYSLINPGAYLDSNMTGFINIIENSSSNKIKKFIFASSSSVYGDQKKFPFKENFNLKPNNIYSLSKKFNEDVAKDVSVKSKMQIIGLRFFTVYGNLGRPDMFIYKLLNSIMNNRKFMLNNHGNHKRDFTHIDDVLKVFKKLLFAKLNLNKYDIFNICSSKPIDIRKIVKIVEKNLTKRAKIVKIPKNKVDVMLTHGCNQKLRNTLKIKKFKKFDDELKILIQNYIKDKLWHLS